MAAATPRADVTADGWVEPAPRNSRLGGTLREEMMKQYMQEQLNNNQTEETGWIKEEMTLEKVNQKKKNNITGPYESK